MTLRDPLRTTRAFISRMRSVSARTRAASSPDSSQVQIEPSLDPIIERQRIIAGIVKGQVTVVVPALNEADAISQVIEEIKREGYGNILVVDGYSTDNTDRVAHRNGVKVVYQHGIGKAGAVKTAIEHVETPYILFMDADHTYDPAHIWRLLNHSEHYAHVIGARDNRHVPRIHRFGNWIISRVFSILFDVKVSDVCSGMYLLRTKEAKKYNVKEHGFVVEIELAAQSASMKTLTEVPIGYRERIGTRKLNTLRDGWAILLSALGLARRYNPILLYSLLASLSAIPAAIVLGWVAVERLAKNIWHSGWVLIGMMLLFVAAQAFTLASLSILTKHLESRLLRELRSSA